MKRWFRLGATFLSIEMHRDQVAPESSKTTGSELPM